MDLSLVKTDCFFFQSPTPLIKGWLKTAKVMMHWSCGGPKKVSILSNGWGPKRNKNNDDTNMDFYL